MWIALYTSPDGHMLAQANTFIASQYSTIYTAMQYCVFIRLPRSNRRVANRTNWTKQIVSITVILQFDSMAFIGRSRPLVDG
jgi:hypothetical protein